MIRGHRDSPALSSNWLPKQVGQHGVVQQGRVACDSESVRNFLRVLWPLEQGPCHPLIVRDGGHEPGTVFLLAGLDDPVLQVIKTLPVARIRQPVRRAGCIQSTDHAINDRLEPVVVSEAATIVASHQLSQFELVLPECLQQPR